MFKIKLEDGQYRLLKNAYGNNIQVYRDGERYYILDNGQKGKAYSTVLVDVVKNKDLSTETMVVGFDSGTSDVYTIGKYGLEFLSRIDQTKDMAKQMAQKINVSSEFPDCELCDKSGKYHVYKDEKGRFFAVDISKPILDVKRYKKFDSYTELYANGKLNGITLFNDFVNSRVENPYLKQFVSIFRSVFSKLENQTENLMSYKLIYPVLLRYLSEIKEKIGVEEYRNMTKPLNLIVSQYSMLDLEQLKEEMIQQCSTIIGKIRGSADSEWDTRSKFFYNAKNEIEETIERITHRLKEVRVEYGDDEIIHKYSENLLDPKELTGEEFYNMMKLYPYSKVGKMIKDNPQECSDISLKFYLKAKDIERSGIEPEEKE